MVDLDNTTAIDTNDASFRPLLSKLQGNILSGHGRDHARYLFGRFLSAAGTERRRSVIAAQAPRVTSALRQEEDAAAFNATGQLGPTFCNFFLSKDGYLGLNYTDADIRASLTTTTTRWVKSNFFEGMKAHPEDFDDPAPTDWEENYQGRIDFLFVLADDDVTQLEAARETLLGQLASVAEMWTESGQALRDHEEEGFEPFGFLDDVSQPVFLERHLRRLQPRSNWNPLAPLRLVLVRDGIVRADADAYGSFFAFRKLEQNVRKFIKAEQDLARALQLQGGDRARAGAMVVGRFRDGTPLELGGKSGDAPKADDFGFKLREPARCPWHAHIRKANPRGDLVQVAGNELAANERSHRIVRRSIPYGTPTLRPSVDSHLDDLPEVGVGLLFGCFQASLQRQFGHLQRMWLGALGKDHPTSNSGADPLMTRAPAGSLQWPTEYDVNVTQQADFQQAVTLKGGEFFFAPSLPFIQAL